MLGQAIKGLRQMKKMTQEQLIELADLSRSQLYYIEAGIRTPHFLTMLSICAALEVSLLEFFEFMYRNSSM